MTKKMVKCRPLVVTIDNKVFSHSFRIDAGKNVNDNVEILSITWLHIIQKCEQRRKLSKYVPEGKVRIEDGHNTTQVFLDTATGKRWLRRAFREIKDYLEEDLWDLNDEEI